MKGYVYAGVLQPSLDADKFMTSLFKKGDDYYVQVEEGEKITGFRPIEITRPILSPPGEAVVVTENEDYLYSFLTGASELKFGTRREMELQLLPLLSIEDLSVHSRLMISSFLNLYQKRIELICDSNENLREKGLDYKISPDLPFMDTTDYVTHSHAVLKKILEKYQRFKERNNSIRLEDIAFLNKDRAFFNNYNLKIELLANKHCLQVPEHKQMMSELIMVFVQKDRELLKTFLFGHTEAYKFLLSSEYIILQQSEIESFLSQKVSVRGISPDTSVLEVGINVDKLLYETAIEPLDKVLDGASDEAEDVLRESESSSLDQSVEAIIRFFK
ncbi:hypothetical protein SAMN05421820_116100 [Pedobacter steynii]|uniref:Uncharacterized protein n=1 Tax=Pedobacter steynii TaxID=430522 RepID=A0A1H0KMU3_9SPHI|nr:hypothetical protein [Pedobacter steynii]NQX43332.1 hypothetical protein [Pedobacter steynii]SDO57126.1 hypothetical protein SAMN05421820_116100 [Pedobacter steynii]